jgi:hypothetical protein
MMATGPSDRQAAQGGGRARAWLIIAAVALVLILAFWLFDATGADPTGDDIDPTTDEAPEDESPDVDFGEPEDEPPETE